MRARVLLALGSALGVLVAASIAVSLSAPAAASGLSEGQKTVAPYTGFGGYQLAGEIRQVGATWNVASATPGAIGYGYAATWIGVQDLGNTGPFIQVGTLAYARKGHPTRYEGFWTDNSAARALHVQNLGILDAGDEVSASLTETTSGWNLRFRDLTDQRRSEFLVTFGGGEPLQRAEWVVEDPPISTIAQADAPFPNLATTYFTHLEANHLHPHLERTDAQVLLAANGPILVPTPVEANAFSFNHPRGVVRSYLTIASRIDASSSVIDVALSEWNTTPAAQRTALIESVAATVESCRQSFASLQLPQGDSADRQGFIDALASYHQALLTWVRSGLSDSGPQFQAATETANPYADRIRADLGLPPTSVN